MNEAEYINEFNNIIALAKQEAREETGKELTDAEMTTVERALMNICKSYRQIIESGKYKEVSTNN
jgi:hypothetical protein